MNGLILDENLRMSNLTKMTEDRIQKMTMDDLSEILNSMEESDKKHLINAIKSSKYEIIGNIIEMYTYRVIQEKVRL